MTVLCHKHCNTEQSFLFAEYISVYLKTLKTSDRAHLSFLLWHLFLIHVFLIYCGLDYTSFVGYFGQINKWNLSKYQL